MINQKNSEIAMGLPGQQWIELIVLGTRQFCDSERNHPSHERR